MSSRSSLRWEPRSQPCAIGECGSSAPWKVTSRPRSSKARTMRNRSASSRSWRRTDSLAAADLVIGLQVGHPARTCAVPHPRIALRRSLGDRLRRERSAGRVEVELRPACPRDRPRLLAPRDERSVDVADVQRHRRPLVPAVVGVREKTIQELPLDLAAVVGVVVRPVLEAVHLEPLALRAGPHEALGVAPQMEAVAAPVAGRENGHLDPGEVGDPRGEVVVDQRMLAHVGAEVDAVGGRVHSAESVCSPVTARPSAAASAALADTVLDGLDLMAIPVVGEGAEDPAVVGRVAVPVGALQT